MCTAVMLVPNTASEEGLYTAVVMKRESKAPWMCCGAVRIQRIAEVGGFPLVVAGVVLVVHEVQRQYRVIGCTEHSMLRRYGCDMTSYCRVQQSWSCTLS